MAYIIPSKKIYEINNPKVRKNNFNSVESFFNNVTIDFGADHTESKSYDMDSLDYPNYDDIVNYRSGEKSNAILVGNVSYRAMCQTICSVTTNSYGKQEIEVDNNFDLSTENIFRDIKATNRKVYRTIEKGTVLYENNNIRIDEFSSSSTILEPEYSTTYNYNYKYDSPETESDLVYDGLITRKVGFKISETTIDGQSHISIDFNCICTVNGYYFGKTATAKEQRNYYNFLECQAVERESSGQKITFRAPIIKGFVLYIICDSIKDSAENQSLACYKITFESKSLDVHYTIGGNKITFDEKPVKFGGSNGIKDSRDLAFKINSNELSQDYNQRLGLCNIVQEQYKNGKETAIIKCSIGTAIGLETVYMYKGDEIWNKYIEEDYSDNCLIYKKEIGNKVVSVKNTAVIFETTDSLKTEILYDGSIRIFPPQYYDISDISSLYIDCEITKLCFESFDEVIPMIPKPVIHEPVIHGGFDPMSYIDVPLATYSDGNPKEFIVVGTKTIYDGAIWQELTLQEKAQENI